MTMNERVENLKLIKKGIEEARLHDRRTDYMWVEILQQVIEDMERAALKSAEKAFKSHVARKATA